MHTSYWGGRSSRKEYWLAVAVLAVLQAVVVVTPVPSGASIGMMVAWSLVFSRRLHDLGRTGWWVAAMYGLQLALVVAGLLVGGEGAVALLRGDTAGAENAEGYPFAAMFLGLVAALLVQLAFTVWLGVVRGTPGENRFGTPPAGRRASAAA